jgi:lipoate-protein ligase B
MTDPGTLSVCHLGGTPYREGLRLQQALVRARAAGATGDWLLYPDHPPVLTSGRGGHADSLIVDRATLERLGIELFEVARGGDLTWHGPGQLVGYAICDLERRGRDLHRFLRDLEAALVATLESYGLGGATVPGRTGVWVGEAKIASIGIAVRRWVSYHGFALNVAPDLGFFDLIHPCGLRGIRMTSLEALLGPAGADLGNARRRAAAAVAAQLGYRELRWAERQEVLEIAGRAADPAAGEAEPGIRAGHEHAA